MSWTYQISTGEMTDPDGSLVDTGYSGKGDGLNNPDMQNVPRVGPIPIGVYTIGPAYHDPEKGPCVMRLTPDPDNEMFGRAGFLCHGDNPQANHTASEGCIIQGPITREAINASDDKTLVVVS